MIKLAVLFVVIGVVVNGQEVDCNKELSDCPQNAPCHAATAKSCGGKGFAFQCKCSCDLLLNCPDKEQSEEATEGTTEGTTTAAETTAAPTTAAATEAAGCFSGDMQVMTDMGQMSVRDLAHNRNAQVQVMDESGAIRLGKVWMWVHNHHDQAAEYLQVTAGGATMELTAEHLAYTVPCEGGERTAKFADKLRAGECTLVQRGSEAVPAVITDIQAVEKTGVYSFVTETGTAVVNGVVASSYNTVEHERLQHLFFSGLHAIMDLLPTSFFGTGASYLDYPIYFAHSIAEFSPMH